MARTKRSLDERIRELELELLELEEQYKTQLYFETMPEYDPLYKYSYAASNMKVSNVHHHADHWLRAVIKHMATRRAAHGGASTSAVLISVPIGLSEEGINKWLLYTNQILRTKARKHRSWNNKKGKPI